MQALSRPQDVVHNRIAGPQLSPKEIESYSLTRAIEAARLGSWREAGFEREVALDILARHGDNDRHPHRLMVPAAVLVQRDLNVATTSAGGYLVENQVLGVVDALRPTSVVLRSGARTITGLQPGASYARQGGSSTITWLASETAAATETADFALASIAIAPKTVSAYVEMSRNMKLMAPELSESMVRNDLRQSLRLALDAAALNGSGTSGVPLGVLNTAGIGTFPGASLAYAGVLEAQTDILTANALAEGGRVGFACRPAVASLLAARQGFSTLVPMWAGPLAAGTVAGCSAYSTMNMPASTLLAGDFTQMVIAEWGAGLEIQVNPYAAFQVGLTGYRALLSVDVALLVKEAFTVATSVT